MRRTSRFRWEWAVLVPSPETAEFRKSVARGAAATKALARKRARRAYRGYVG